MKKYPLKNNEITESFRKKINFHCLIIKRNIKYQTKVTKQLGTIRIVIELKPSCFNNLFLNFNRVVRFSVICDCDQYH